MGDQKACIQPIMHRVERELKGSECMPKAFVWYGKMPIRRQLPPMHHPSMVRKTTTTTTATSLTANHVWMAMDRHC